MSHLAAFQCQSKHLGFDDLDPGWCSYHGLGDCDSWLGRTLPPVMFMFRMDGLRRGRRRRDNSGENGRLVLARAEPCRIISEAGDRCDCAARNEFGNRLGNRLCLGCRFGRDCGGSLGSRTRVIRCRCGLSSALARGGGLASNSS